MKLSEIADNAGARKKRMRIGRGIGSGAGKTGGRGGKGQTARSGVRIKGFEGGQMPLHRRLPKRGFNNIFRIEYAVVNLDQLEERFETGATVSPDTLRAAGLVRSKRTPIKVLGRGDLTKALTVQAHKFSGKAAEKLAASGGTAETIADGKAETTA